MQSDVLDELWAQGLATADPATRALLRDDRLSVEAAFQAGLLQVREPRRLASLARSLPAASAGEPMESRAARLHPEPALELARLLGGEGDALHGAGAVAHPWAHVILLAPTLRALMRDPALGPDVETVLHASHELRLRRPLRPGAVYRVHGQCWRASTEGGRAEVEAELALHQAGEPVVVVRTRFVRPTGPPRGGRALPAPPPDGERALVPPLDLAPRYAALSGDDNPIHTDEQAARRGGHPRPILHGLCTLGLAGQALLDVLERGDVRPLRRLAGRFRRPVLPGQAITLRWWRNPLGARFDLRDERGHLLLDHGILETSWSHE